VVIIEIRVHDRPVVFAARNQRDRLPSKEKVVRILRMQPDRNCLISRHLRFDQERKDQQGRKNSDNGFHDGFALEPS